METEGSDEPVATASPIGAWRSQAGEAVVANFFTLAATWYCVSERDAIIKLLTALAPEAKRNKARETYLALDGLLGAYTRLRFLMVFAVGAVLSTGFYVIGLNYWLLVGAFVGLIEIVPVIGPIVGSILVLAVGIPQSLHIAALSLRWLVLVREFKNYVVNPRIGQTVGLSGGCDAHQRSRARPRPARRATSPLAPAPSLAMSTAARVTVRNSARAPL